MSLWSRNWLCELWLPAYEKAAVLGVCEMLLWPVEWNRLPCNSAGISCCEGQACKLGKDTTVEGAWCGGICLLECIIFWLTVLPGSVVRVSLWRFQTGSD